MEAYSSSLDQSKASGASFGWSTDWPRFARLALRRDAPLYAETAETASAVLPFACACKRFSRRPRFVSVTSALLANLSTSLRMTDETTDLSSEPRYCALLPKRVLNLSVRASLRSSRFLRLTSFSLRASDIREFTERLPSEAAVFMRLGAI